MPDETVEDGDAPLGEVLGPLPLWAVVAVIAALVGEGLGPLAGASVGAGVTPVLVVLGLLCSAVMVTVLVTVRGSAARDGGEAARARSGAMLLGGGLVAVVVAVAALVRLLALESGSLVELAAQGGVRRLEAEVVHEPRPIASGWHVLVRVTAVDGQPTRERAAFTLDDVDTPPTLGSRWELTASARPLPEGGYGRWLSRQHASVVLDLRDRVAADTPGALAAASEHVRARIRAAATRYLDDRVGGLLVGFVTGDTRLLPDADVAAMRATSLTHLTAVSGANVAIVAGGTLVLLTALRVGARGRRRVLAITVVGFAFLTRFEPSVLRAGTMALLVLLVAARGMPRDARHALAGAVLVLVLLDPRLAGSLGLLLSATATAGVLVAAPVVARRLGRLPRRLRTVVAITIGAQIAVVPLLLGTFGEVPLASLPANVIAVPAAAIAASLSFLGSVAATVAVELGAPLFWLAGWPARIVLGAAHGLADVGGTASVDRPTTVVALTAGCVWVLAPPRTRSARWAGAAVSVTLAVALALPVIGGLPPRELTVTAIDVGQGDAFLVESPQARILIDAGGDEAAARWLRHHGRRHLDLVIVTHPHLDHVGGVPEVLRRLRVDAVWYRPVPTDLPAAAEVLAVAAARAVPVVGPEPGQQVRVGDLDLEVLHPPPGRPYRWSRSEPNDTSIVVRITWGDRRVLATGDIEEPAQQELLAERPMQLRAELLLVPHHGAGTTEPAFLTAVAPQVALISVGHGNPYGHPAPHVVAWLEQLGAAVHRTDRDGTVQVTVPSPQEVPAAGRASDGSAVVTPAEPGKVARRLPSGDGGRHRRRRGMPPLPPRRRGIHGRVPDVPQDGHTGLHPAAVLARGPGRDRHRDLPHDAGRQRPARRRHARARADRRPDLR